MHPFVVLEGSDEANSPEQLRDIFCNVVNPTKHCQLQNDLINYLWDHYNNADD